MRLGDAKQGPECLIKEQGVLENILESVGIRETKSSRGSEERVEMTEPHRGSWILAEDR